MNMAHAHHEISGLHDYLSYHRNHRGNNEPNEHNDPSINLHKSHEAQRAHHFNEGNRQEDLALKALGYDESKDTPGSKHEAMRKYAENPFSQMGRRQKMREDFDEFEG